MPPVGLALLLLAGCATPGAPTGGPVDTTPPRLVSSLPVDGATQVSGRTVTLTFSERLDGASASAVTVAPALSSPPEVRVSGREIEITLPALRDSTTYVLTLGTALKDNHDVALQAPITVAFATGDVIDRASISGSVRSPETGAGVRAAVWAYAAADSTARLDGEPDYRTETGADGAFTLAYLRRADYAVVAVQDRNRNGRLDPGERFAAPPRIPLRADTTRADTARADTAPFWLTALDATPPTAQRVRTFSDRRLAVRFGEAVRLQSADSEPWTLADSASGRTVGLRVYQPTDAPFEIWVEADEALAPVRHRIAYAPPEPAAITDSSGLGAEAFSLSFTPSASPDTAQVRFVGFVPGTARDTSVTLGPGQRPGVTFSGPLTPAGLAERVTVDGAGENAAFSTVDGLTYTLAGDATAAALTVRTPDSTFVRRFAVAGARETGAIVGRVQGGGPVVVEARPDTGDPVQVSTLPDGTFAVPGLLPGPYTLRIWRDLDGDRQWSGGAVVPYRAPEPLRLILTPIQVRARWETEIDPVVL